MNPFDDPIIALARFRRRIWEMLPFTNTPAKKAARMLEDPWTDVDDGTGAIKYAQFLQTKSYLRAQHQGTKLLPKIIDALWWVLARQGAWTLLIYLIIIYLVSRAAR